MTAHATSQRRRRQALRPRPQSPAAPESLFALCDQGPVFRTRRVRIESDRRGRAMAYGGLALAHKLAHSLDLPAALDREVELLKRHAPYHESDHILTHAYNIFAGGTCIEDIASLQNSEAFMKLVGASRVPDPTTAGDFLRRFSPGTLGAADGVLDDVRAKVWKALPRNSRRQATVDLDSTIRPVYGECKQGAAFSYKGTWSYHPLLISLAETNECLRLINRPGNATSADGVEEALDPCLGRLTEHFRHVVVRGDSAFYRGELMRLCLAHGVDFALVMKSSAGLVEAAEALRGGCWEPFSSQPGKPQRRGSRRRRRQRCKRARLRRAEAQRRGYRTLSTVSEWVAEMRYRPSGLDRDFRVVVKRQLIREKKQKALFEHYEYRFVITSIENMTAAGLVRFAYGRCNQENTIEQLKNGLAALRMPTGELLANAAFMLAAVIAWSLRSWLSLLALPAESLRWEWKRFRHAFVYVSSRIVTGARQVTARIAGSHRFTSQILAASERLDALAPD
ncbi:MAG TPA: IS1380 family transposase [Solirubrobacterales bacterium]|nr:IS1380 family transposase [Solirubrobacterales bacterium]